MEVIKKTVLQALTTGKTGNNIIIIPNTSAIYYFKINLTQEVHNLGFFGAPLESTIVSCFRKYNSNIP